MLDPKTIDELQCALDLVFMVMEGDGMGIYEAAEKTGRAYSYLYRLKKYGITLRTGIGVIMDLAKVVGLSVHIENHRVYLRIESKEIDNGKTFSGNQEIEAVSTDVASTFDDRSTGGNGQDDDSDRGVEDPEGDRIDTHAVATTG